MSDLLSAASLFLAVIGLLYSAWYKEMTDALTMTISDYKDDRGPEIHNLKVVYQTRALPLAFASGILAMILFIDLISITLEAVLLFANKGFSAIKSYDAVKTLFWVIALSSILLAVHILQVAYQLCLRWKKAY